MRGQGTASRTYLEDGVITSQVGGANDLARGTGIDQEVLAEALAWPERLGVRPIEPGAHAILNGSAA